LLAADEWISPDVLPASQTTSRPRLRERPIHETLRSERPPNATTPLRPDYRPAHEVKAIDEALADDVELEFVFDAYTDLDPMPRVE